MSGEYRVDGPGLGNIGGREEDDGDGQLGAPRHILPLSALKVEACAAEQLEHLLAKAALLGDGKGDALLDGAAFVGFAGWCLQAVAVA